eukprot:945595-Pelagomonas_calceolata.AAC.1
MQIPGDRKGCAMNRQGSQRKCHPMVKFSQFVCVLTLFSQGISIPHTSQPFSQFNNELPHDHRLPRPNAMNEKRVAPLQAHACSQIMRSTFTRKTAHLNICSQHLAECRIVAAQ